MLLAISLALFLYDGGGGGGGRWCHAVVLPTANWTADFDHPRIVDRPQTTTPFVQPIDEWPVDYDEEPEEPEPGHATVVDRPLVPQPHDVDHVVVDRPLDHTRPDVDHVVVVDSLPTTTEHPVDHVMINDTDCYTYSIPGPTGL